MACSNLELLQYLCLSAQGKETQPIDIPNEIQEECSVLVDQWRFLIQNEAQNPHNDYKALYAALAQIFYKLENNGDPATHAEHLSYLFPKALTAAKYLAYYAKHSTAQQPLHNLCMSIYKTEEPMPDLRKFGVKNIRYLFKNLNLLETITTYHVLLTKRVSIDKLNQYIIPDMIKWVNEILRASASIKYEELSETERKTLTVIQKINERFERPSFENAKEIIETLRLAQNSDALLPKLTIPSETVGLKPGFYITKLHEADIRNAMAGFFTGSCMRIGGAGASCAIHSITSALGGMYVLFNGKISEDGTTTLMDEQNDQPLVMAWTFANYDEEQQEFNGIIFDSLEYDKVSNKILPQMLPEDAISDTPEPAFIAIEVFFKEYAQLLLAQLPENIKIIQVGTGGKTPANVGSRPISAHEVRHFSARESINRPFTGYIRDSRIQRILACRSHSLYYQIHSLNFKKLLPQLVALQDDEINIQLWDQI